MCSSCVANVNMCLCFQARSAEIPELRVEPLMRSCSSSTASMKVKNVKKWVDTHTHLFLPISNTLLSTVYLFLSLWTGSLSPLFPAQVPSIPSVCFCVFPLLIVPRFALHMLSWTQDHKTRPNKLYICMFYVFRLSFTRGHFPKLAECAHFHYENVDFGTIQVRP